MTIDKLSPKQTEILQFGFDDAYDTLICDGAVRSGKTIAMIIGFIIWAMDTFDGANFGICGKTVQSAERNVITPGMEIEGLPYKFDYKRSTKLLTVRCGRKVNSFYIFGGKDEASYMLIQGITLAGVLFDEVALMPRSFVDQAITRTLSVDGSKLWFNCNPESPTHWFYEEYIKHKPDNAKHLHFLMLDNPIMTADKIAKAESKFVGVFYRRYILGEWVRAEGAIYPQFSENLDMFMCESCTDNLMLVVIGIDYGASKSKTVFKAVGFSFGFKNVWALDECDTEGIKTPDAIYRNFELFYRRVVQNYGMCQFVYADYGALGQILTSGLKQYFMSAGLPVVIKDCLKGEIFERIELTSNLMALGRLKVLKKCDNLKKAFMDAVWDDKHQDERLDDGTSDIDSLDAFEYAIFPYHNKLR